MVLMYRRNLSPTESIDDTKVYDIHKTPTFFILDADKRIIAKPGNDKEVVGFFDKHQTTNPKLQTPTTFSNP